MTGRLLSSMGRGEFSSLGLSTTPEAPLKCGKPHTEGQGWGLDAIDTYVFWNLHEPSPGKYNFEGRYDLVRFIKLIQKAGGFPVWLKFVPGVSFRTDNEPFKMAMQRFTQKIVQMMKNEKLFESQGGLSSSLSCNGYRVPWVMCKEDDAPDPVYHGGTNFGRTAGGPFITLAMTTMLQLMNMQLQWLPTQSLYGLSLVSHESEVEIFQVLIFEAQVFYSESGGCAAFLSNYNPTSAARVTFNSMHYNLAPWSISILPDCKNVVFNTATVGVQTSQMQMLPTNSELLSWETFNEDISSADDDSTITVVGLLEQLNVTRDTSDYLWYSTRIDISSSESFLHGGQHPTLIVQSTGHAMHVFINGHLSGSAFGTREDRRFTFTGDVNLQTGSNIISVLSIAVGLPNNGPHFETWSTGVLGPVVLHGLDEGKKDLSWQKWSYQVGLKGEAMNLVSPNVISNIDWMKGSLFAQKQQPLTWYKAYFDAPDGDEPLALDMGSMGKGQVWINGQSIGRYWTAYAKGNCSGCSYSGTFRTTKCQFGCGQPTQRWYHVPRSWLKPTQNLLVLFEELGGDASKISFMKRSVTTVCAEVSEHHPNIKNWHIESQERPEEMSKPKVHLHCASGQSISAIKFASFGTPSGTCGNFQKGTCHAPTSQAVLEKQKCSVAVSSSNFANPCPNMFKKLSVEAVCAPSTTSNA
ncbi:Beta-galactosidase 3 [Vitis vinifera]|uniref:beta-galactosidase n=1 Tax=Vitis vinifera TaxID=29760 RepID=A0A438I9J0_VITVI|nr:Beta-galactosidase 3 [Vitis vinifera]